MFFACDLGWFFAVLSAIASAIYIHRSRSRRLLLENSHRSALDAAAATIDDLNSEVAVKQKAIESAAAIENASSKRISALKATEEGLRRDTESQSHLLTSKAQAIEAKDALIAKLEDSLVDERAKVAALTADRARPKIASRKTVFDLPYSEALEIGPLLNACLPYLRENAAYRISCCIPTDTVVYAVHSAAGKNEAVTYTVVRQSESLARGTPRWIIAGDSEQKHIVDFQAEATVFITKLRLATGDFEHLKIGDCVDIARDLSHLLAAGGLSILRVLSSMNTSLKLDKVERKIDNIIRLLNAEQIGRFNGIFLAAGEEFRVGSIDQTSAKSLRHDLLRLECELLAELRSLLMSAPDPRMFQLIWGQLTRAGREEFFNKHFLGGIGKVRLALAAFIVDLILVQELDGRGQFFAATVRQQATELRGITKALGSQLSVIKDGDRVEEVTSLHKVCEQFSRLLEQLAAVPDENGLPPVA